MNNYVVLSEKTWNSALIKELKRIFPDSNWLLINEKGKFVIEELVKIKPKKIFIHNWSYLISTDIHKSFECIVFHMTDLPFGRGGSPLQNLIIRGHKETLISALKVIEDVDAGPIYIKKELSLLGTAEEIFIKSNDIIRDMIIEIIRKDLKPKNQTGEVTFFQRRKPIMSRIDELSEIDSLFDSIRMMDADGYPKAYLETKYFKFEFSRASIKSDNSILADVRIIKK